MGSLHEVITLPDLCEGPCDDYVVVKVDRIINKEVVCFPIGQHRPLRELTTVLLVLFDQSMTCKIAVMEEQSVIERLGPMFGKDKCYSISNFLVRRSGEGSRVKLYIKILPIRIVVFTSAELPKHCFALHTVSHILRGHNTTWGLVDVCGVLKAIVELGLGHSASLYNKEVVLMLEEKGVLAVGSNKVLSCSLIGKTVYTTIRAYEAVESEENVFVVIQFAMVTHFAHGVPTLTSFHNATRVFFNPTYLEVYEQRIAVLYRILPDASSASLPIV